MQRYGDRDYRGCCTSLQEAPFKEELKAWEVGVYLGPRQSVYKCLLGCAEDRRCSDHRRAANVLCKKCEVPLCEMFHHYLLEKRPARHLPIAYTNDLLGL